MLWKTMMMNAKVTSLTQTNNRNQITLAQTIPDDDDIFKIELNQRAYNKLGNLSLNMDVNFHILINDRCLNDKKLPKRQMKLRNEGILCVDPKEVPMRYLSLNLQIGKGLKEIFSEPWITAKLIHWNKHPEALKINP